jgi:hypothetical protein
MVLAGKRVGIAYAQQLAMKTHPALVGIGVVAMVLTGMAMLIRRVTGHFAPAPTTVPRDAAAIARMENEGGHPKPMEGTS